MKLAFIGTGYVGLVSGVMMSHIGHQVTCIDTDFNKIAKLKQLESPIFEVGLEEYIKKYGNSEDLTFIHGYESLKKQNFDAIFITVGTPSKDDGSANLNYIFDAIDQLTANDLLSSEGILVIKSTVPPTSSKKIKKYLTDKGLQIEVVSNPEFLREGTAIHDFINPDRIVIGVESERALEIMGDIYKPLVGSGVKLIVTDLNTSELIKYAANSFLANKIAFINEMADLCEIVDADINELAIGIGSDRRIGQDFLKAGPGFGGSCFPKDILALQHLVKEVGSNSLILDAVIEANSRRVLTMLAKIKRIFLGELTGKNLAIMGLAYKAGTDDIRSSPSIKLIEELQQEGVNITAYDPKAIENITLYFDKLDFKNSAFEAANNVDAVVFLTEWSEFKEIDFVKLKSIIKQPIIIDLRNFLDPNHLNQLGYKYYSIGKNDYK